MLTQKELMEHAIHDFYATLAATCQDDTFSSIIDPEKAKTFPTLGAWLLDSGHTKDDVWEHRPDIAQDEGWDEPDWL